MKTSQYFITTLLGLSLAILTFASGKHLKNPIRKVMPIAMTMNYVEAQPPIDR